MCIRDSDEVAHEDLDLPVLRDAVEGEAICKVRHLPAARELRKPARADRLDVVRQHVHPPSLEVLVRFLFLDSRLENE